MIQIQELIKHFVLGIVSIFIIHNAMADDTKIRNFLNEIREVKEEYTKEIRTLESFLSSEVKRVMGDTEINLDSSEDRSRVIFSREALDKKRWAMIFNLGYEDRGNSRRKKRPKRMTPAVLSQNIARQTRLLYKTKMESCNKCGGSGHFYALKKDGFTKML